MKKPILMVKVTVAASSVLLVGGYILFQAGSLGWLQGNIENAAASTKSKTPVKAAKKKPTFIPSSKLIILDGFSKEKSVDAILKQYQTAIEEKN